MLTFQDTNVALIRELRREIERLHGMLADAQKVNYLPCFFIVTEYQREINVVVFVNSIVGVIVHILFCKITV